MPRARRAAVALFASTALSTALGVASACAAIAPATSAKADFLSSSLDRSVDPGTDFFGYANGGWLKANPIPASEAGWGIGELVEEQINAQLRRINEAAAAVKSEPGSDAQRIGDYWSTAMDEARAEAAGVHPLDGQLARIDRIEKLDDVLDATFEFLPIAGAFFSFSIQQDEKNSDAMTVHLGQGGLGLPDRDFYFNTEPGVAKVRTEYVAHVARLLELLGKPKAEAPEAAEDVMRLEISLAQVSRKLEALRDPDANYNRMTPEQLSNRHTVTIDWEVRLASLGIDTDTVIVGQPEFFHELQSILRVAPLRVLRDYLRVRVASAYAPYLSKAFYQEHFRFYGQALSGQEVPRDRFKRVLDAEDNAIGMLVGRAWVDQYVSPNAKARYATLVESIRTSYLERIARLDWMSEETRARARAKLLAMTVKVGYPDHWESYRGLAIGRDSWAANMMASARWHFADEIARLKRPVDRTEWEMTPQTYNAYYASSNNEIVLPAAAFVIPGVRDEDIDDAVLYGYAGASTIGHEITHGFDDEGRHFDAKGNLTQWWTAEDEKRFTARADVMVKQFDAYEPLPGLHINGSATLGENIADYGGILLGLDAFHKTVQFKEGQPLAGLTPDQRFFLGYALSWQYHDRSERLRQRLLSDVHSPPHWRVNGPLSNVPEFFQAFGIDAGKPMRRADDQHVHIW